MAMVYQSCEILKDGKPTGKWRFTSRSDEEKSVPHKGLCSHEHDSPEEASACSDAKAKLPRYMRQRESTLMICEITPTCRENRGRMEAFDESCRRLRKLYESEVNREQPDDIWKVKLSLETTI